MPVLFPWEGADRLVHSFSPLADYDCGAAAAWIAAAGELPGLGVARDRLHAAEVEVALLPALNGPATALERLERARVHPGLCLDDAALEMQARQLDGVL